LTSLAWLPYFEPIYYCKQEAADDVEMKFKADDRALVSRCDAGKERTATPRLKAPDPICVVIV
jgi:hypothetical protein